MNELKTTILITAPSKKGGITFKDLRDLVKRAEEAGVPDETVVRARTYLDTASIPKARTIALGEG